MIVAQRILAGIFGQCQKELPESAATRCRDSYELSSTEYSGESNDSHRNNVNFCFVLLSGLNVNCYGTSIFSRRAHSFFPFFSLFFHLTRDFEKCSPTTADNFVYSKNVVYLPCYFLNILTRYKDKTVREVVVRRSFLDDEIRRLCNSRRNETAIEEIAITRFHRNSPCLLALC